MSRFHEIKPRLMARPVSRVRLLDLPDSVTMSDDRAERMQGYRSRRWDRLRGSMLATSCRRCFFCGDKASVLEHLVGHGSDALAVASALGIPAPDPDWRRRFWSGPFGGACLACARTRSGHEAKGGLLGWTESWLGRRLG